MQSCCTDSCSISDTPWLRLAVGLFVAAQTMSLGMAINITPPESALTLRLLQGGMLAATLVVVALLGWPLAREAASELARRRITMELLFIVALLAAMAISVVSMARGTGPVYFETVNVLLVVYSVGRAVGAYSRGKALAAMRPLLEGVETARRIGRGGDEMVASSELRVGDHVRVLPGELVPVDGWVCEGESLVRQTAFTGDLVPARRQAGDSVLAGSGCEDGTLIVEATAAGADRRIDRLMALLENARNTPTDLQRQADRFVRWFLPVVAATAYATLIHWGFRASWDRGLMYALSVLLVACPCAAGLATPLAVWSVLGRLAGRGLILRDGGAVERLASVDGVVFDKTGTLAEEELELVDIEAAESDRPLVFALVRAIEAHSAHPVARALARVDVPEGAPKVLVLAVRTLVGRGIEAEVAVGEEAATQTVRLVRDEVWSSEGGLVIRLETPVFLARLRLRERLRGSAEDAVAELRRMGLPVRIYTGDSLAGAAAAGRLAPTLASLTPESKHDRLRGEFAWPLFVGDGLNDAAAMAAAHAGIALASGARLTIESASATLHGGDLRRIPEAIALSRRAVGAVRSNLHWAMGYNLIGVIAAAAGWLHPILASVLMAASSMFVSWRSFHLIGSPAISSSRGRLPKAFLLAHLIGLAGQAIVLALLADISFISTAILVVAFTALIWPIARWSQRMPCWLDMTIGMVSLGGLGMNFGWWMDMGFRPAIQNGLAMHCCGANTTWMYWGMLVVGVPAMYLLRRTPERFEWRKWCCVGPLVLGIPGMCLGMWAGGMLADALTALSPATRIIAAGILMNAGMAAGMLAAHAAAFLAPSTSNQRLRPKELVEQRREEAADQERQVGAERH